MNVKKDNGFDFGDETKVADEAAKVEAEIEQHCRAASRQGRRDC